MKKYISMILAVVLLLSCILTAPVKVDAAQKATVSRSIAIVFDNSGSMYEKNNQAWCRATYAMEVFAAMLNETDELQIYPMNPIMVGSTQYTMETPLVIKNPKEGVEKIHKIFTPHEDWKEKKDGTRTHIESIDYAASGLEKTRGDEKYLIILTDGTNFYENNKDLAGNSKKALETRLKSLVDKRSMKVMYLGIDSVGEKATMPTVKSEYYVSKRAESSTDVLATLTELCNQIFGRDSIPANYKPGKNVNFDISMKKLIVFVQGENIEGLKLTTSSGSAVSGLVSTQKTQYSTSGTGKADLDNNPDTSLQGMMVTYEGLAAGNYTIDFSGMHSSIEVYYEPDADLSFVFTDAAGNNVDPNALYEGDYKVSFGMKDGQTGQLINSELLGSPSYEGHYYIDEKPYPISKEGFSGNVDIPLKMGEKFKADLEVTYLSGYKIAKNSSDFGWPEFGIQVAARPAGDLNLEITGGETLYSLQDLEKGAPYIAKIYYQGTQLTGAELEKVELKWQPETSNAEIKWSFENDHFALSLHYKDENAPENTVCGKCTVNIQALYTAQGSSQAQTTTQLTYNIKDDFSPLRLQMLVNEPYLVISELQDSQEIVIKMQMQGKDLSAQEFDAVKMQVDCDGIKHTLTPNKADSSYSLKLLATDGIAEGDYRLKVTAQHTDHIGRQTQTGTESVVTLGSMPLWLKWLLFFVGLLLVILFIWWILHRRLYPACVRADEDNCKMKVGARQVEGAEFYAKRTGNTLECRVEYAGESMSVSMNNVTPGKDSYLYKRSVKRSILMAHPEAVSYFGDVTSADIDGTSYKVNRDGEMLLSDPETPPFTLRNDAIITFNGTILENGQERSFHAEVPITFRKL